MAGLHISSHHKAAVGRSVCCRHMPQRIVTGESVSNPAKSLRWCRMENRQPSGLQNVSYQSWRAREVSVTFLGKRLWI